MSNKKPNCVNLAFIFKTSVGSVNASFSEDNVTVIKKITLPDGRELPYISGQAMRYYIRQKWEEMDLRVSPVTQTRTPIGRAASSKCDPVQFIDDDLFGFLLTGQSKRTSPVRVSPAIAFFPFQDDRDLGTRVTEEGKKDPGKLMPPFETEVYYNYFRSNVLIELDRVGIFKEDYCKDGKMPKNLDEPEKEKRVIALIEAIHDLWGGGKQARFLTDISPKFIIYTRQTAKKPIFLERLEMIPEGEAIKRECIIKTLEDESHLVANVIIGVAEGFGGVTVGEELKYKKCDDSEVSIEVLSLKEAFDEMIKDIKPHI